MDIDIDLEEIPRGVKAKPTSAVDPTKEKGTKIPTTRIADLLIDNTTVAERDLAKRFLDL